MKIFEWLKTRSLVRNLRKQSQAMERKIDRLVKVKDRNERKLDADEARLDKMRDQFNDQLRRTGNRLKEARALNQQLERQLQASQEENAALEQCISTMLAGNQVVLHQYESQSRIEAMRAAVAAGRDREDGF